VSCKKGAAYQASRKTGNGGFDFKAAAWPYFGREISSAIRRLFLYAVNGIDFFLHTYCKKEMSQKPHGKT